MGIGALRGLLLGLGQRELLLAELQHGADQQGTDSGNQQEAEDLPDVGIARLPDGERSQQAAEHAQRQQDEEGLENLVGKNGTNIAEEQHR